MQDIVYLTKEQENAVRSLPRWAKAYLAARAARRAVELVDGNTVAPHFIEVVKTLDEVEKAIEEGKSVKRRSYYLGTADISPARIYADSISKHQRFSTDLYAALAVDDAYGLVSERAEATVDVGAGEEYQLRKIKFAISCAVNSSQNVELKSSLITLIHHDLDVLIDAIQNRGIQSDEHPIPRSILAFHSKIDNTEPLLKEIPTINSQLISRLHKDPEKLYELGSRAFEELIAYLFEYFGYDVELTARTKDGGKDIIAICNKPTKNKYLIECKRYARDNRVGVKILRELHGVVTSDGATAGIVATTSFFSSAAQNYMTQPHVEYRLSGKDFHGIQEWLLDYERNQRIGNTIWCDYEISGSGIVYPKKSKSII